MCGETLRPWFYRLSITLANCIILLTFKYSPLNGRLLVTLLFVWEGQILKKYIYI